MFYIVKKNIIYQKSIKKLKSGEDITLKIYTSKREYYRYELIKIYAKLNREIPNCKIEFKVYYKNEPLITIGEIYYNKMYYDKKEKLWHGIWPIPWDAEVGSYKVEVVGKFSFKEKKILGSGKKYVKIPFLPWIRVEYPEKKKKEKPKILVKEIKKQFKASSYFKIISRPPPEMPKGFAVMDIETAGNILLSQIPNLKGKIGTWHNIYDWAKFLGVDAIFYLVGQTTFWEKYKEGDSPWVKGNIESFPHLAREAKKRGFKFGGWIGCYLTFGKHKYPYYQYNYNYSRKTKSCYPTMSISFKCEKRKKDIIELMKILDKNPDVSFIGLDYIRFAFGGYELVDEFVDEMKPDIPKNFFNLSYKEKMNWLGDKITSKEPLIYDQWNWWRAHKIANLVKELIEKSAVKKPVWVFTLGWDHGKQHGQDPLMMQDAGISIDAVMLYECPKKLFPYMINSWRGYLKGKKINLISGNMVDWFWHQETLIPAGPEEFYYRLIEGTHKIKGDGLAEGIFFHDLGRLLWGRKGPYSSREWAIAGGCAISELKESWGVLPFKIEISSENSVSVRNKFNVKLTIENQTEKNLEKVIIKPLKTEAVTYYSGEKIISIPALKSKEIKIDASIDKYIYSRANRFIIAFEIISSPNRRVIFKYIQAR